MKQRKYCFFLTVVLVFIQVLFISCGNTEKVISSNFIEKRKYMKGYNVNLFSGKISGYKTESYKKKEEQIDEIPVDENTYNSVLAETKAEKNNLHCSDKSNIANSVISEKSFQKTTIVLEEKTAEINLKLLVKSSSEKINNNPENNDGTNKGIAALLCGILSILFLFLPFSGVASVAVLFAILSLINSLLAVFFGLGAIDESKRSQVAGSGSSAGKGLGTIGIVLGLLGLLLWIISMIGILLLSAKS